MTLASTISTVLGEHSQCCITDSYIDEGCGLDVSGLPRRSLTTISGTSYQANHPWQGRLCDRIIIGQTIGNFVSVVELKGGRNIIMSDAIKQIQRGLDLSASLLRAASPENWYPLLVYSGSMSGREKDLLRNKTVSYQGGKARVDRIDCGSSLLVYLNRH